MQILTEIIRDPAVELRRIEMISRQEWTDQIYAYNKTASNYRSHIPIHHLFQEQVGREPEKAAVIFQKETVTYQELGILSDQVATELRNNGVCAGDIVGISVSRSPKMLAAILGILKSGAAYLPIDVEYPAQRIEFILSDSEAKALLTEKRLGSKISSFAGREILLDEMGHFSGIVNSPVLQGRTEPMAYVNYTSGTTGKPKGVAITHRMLHNFLEGIGNSIDITAYETVLNITSISFDIFALETLLPLIKGLAVVLLDENEQKDPQRVKFLMETHNVDVVQMTPSMCRMFADSDMCFSGLRSVKCLVVGGEAFPNDLCDGLNKLPFTRIYNAYGPTETTVWSSIKEFDGRKPVTIGNLIANTQIYLLDKNRNPVQCNTCGEIYISGDGVSYGYINNPILTRQVFLDDPFISGNRMYRTGDIAKRLPNGEILHMGRMDDQVKIRGHRIELGEIEAVLNSCPGISNAVVLTRRNSIGHLQLIAYCQAEAGEPQNLKQWMKQSLPEHMLPARYVWVK